MLRTSVWTFLMWGMTEFFAGVEQTRPRLLHEIAAQDPVAGGKLIFTHPTCLEAIS